MKKQDITLPKTPTDIERKYNLGRSKSAPGSSVQIEIQIQQLSQTLSQFMTTTNGKFAELEKKILPTLDYTVTFKVDNAVYEIMSVKIGNSINAPTTEPRSDSGILHQWQDGEGNKIDFPYTPTGDIELTASFQGEVMAGLYSRYNLSQESYPYVFIVINDSGGIYLVFAKSYTHSAKRLDVTTAKRNYTGTTTNDYGIVAVVEHTKTNITSLSTSDSYAFGAINSNYRIYTNADLSGSNATIYELK